MKGNSRDVLENRGKPAAQTGRVQGLPISPSHQALPTRTTAITRTNRMRAAIHMSGHAWFAGDVQFTRKVGIAPMPGTA